MKSKILYTDGHQQVVKPKNKKKFTKTEVKAHISDTTETIRLEEGTIIMVIDSKGAEKGLKMNVIASKVVGSHIAGDVLLCNKGEF